MVSVEEAIARRKSVRHFLPDPITLAQLSQILWSAQGLQARDGNFRNAPSPGATYPLEIFITCGSNSVKGLDAGIYHYNVNDHSLTLHFAGDARPGLMAAALGQEFVNQAPVDIVICAIYERTQQRYGDRAERYVHMEVGHVGQNIYLQAFALGLATVAVAAFRGREAAEVLKLEPQIRAMYIMPVGKPAR